MLTARANWAAGPIRRGRRVTALKSHEADEDADLQRRRCSRSSAGASQWEASKLSAARFCRSPSPGFPSTLRGQRSLRGRSGVKGSLEVLQGSEVAQGSLRGRSGVKGSLEVLQGSEVAQGSLRGHSEVSD